jgi:thiamine phosphate synthase YjbQ (UPF0047 family)
MVLCRRDAVTCPAGYRSVSTAGRAASPGPRHGPASLVQWLVMDTITWSARTGSAETVLDITDRVAAFARGRGDGLLSVFVPHATAGVAILELGSGSDTDLLATLRELLPVDDRWRHAHGSRGHGRSHVLPAFVPPSVTVPVFDGELALGPGSRSPWSI